VIILLSIPIKLEQIVFDRDVQKQCVSPGFHCPSYEKSWSCPPVSPYLEEEINSFDKFFLIYTTFNIKKYIQQEKVKYPKKSDVRIRYELYATDVTSRNSLVMGGLEKEITEFVDNYNGEFKEKLVLWAGTCRLCRIKMDMPCSMIDDESCRFPEEIRYSMEAVGIDVMRTVRNTGLKLDPVNYEYRFGLVCYK